MYGLKTLLQSSALLIPFNASAANKQHRTLSNPNPQIRMNPTYIVSIVALFFGVTVENPKYDIG